MKPATHSTKMDHDDNPTYHGWLVRVDAHLLNMTGRVSSDFRDTYLQQWFLQRMLPKLAAKNILIESLK